MKGVDALIASVLILIISVTAIFLALQLGTPSTQRAKEILLMQEGKNNLVAIDDAVKNVLTEGEGSVRVLRLSISGGNYKIDNTTNSVLFSMESRSQIIAEGVSKTEDGINFTGTAGIIYLKLSYENIQITNEEELGTGHRTLTIRNNGYNDTTQKQMIYISTVPPTPPMLTFTDRYNQSQTTNITGSASTIGQSAINSYLNINGDGLTWDITEAPVGLSTIAFDNATSMTQATTASSISWSHTTGTGNNRLLLVAIGVHVATGTPTIVRSVTYGGVSLTQVTAALYSATTPRVRTYVFRLINPVSGANTITVNFAATTLSVAGAVTYTGVNQTSPIQTSSTSIGSGTSPSVSVTVSGSGKLLFGHLGGHRTSAWTITEGSGQTNRWMQQAQLYKGGGSDKTVAAGSQSVSWTLSRAANFVASAVVINPAAVYRAEVEHNVTGITWSGNLNSINISLNFSTNVSSTFNFTIYNFNSGSWKTCDSFNPTAGIWYMRWCSITTNPSYYSSSSRVRIRLNETSYESLAKIKEDYVQYYVTYTYSQ